jgi:hypothetical protein
MYLAIDGNNYPKILLTSWIVKGKLHFKISSVFKPKSTAWDRNVVFSRVIPKTRSGPFDMAEMHHDEDEDHCLHIPFSGFSFYPHPECPVDSHRS